MQSKQEEKQRRMSCVSVTSWTPHISLPSTGWQEEFHRLSGWPLCTLLGNTILSCPHKGAHLKLPYRDVYRRSNSPNIIRAMSLEALVQEFLPAVLPAIFLIKSTCQLVVCGLDKGRTILYRQLTILYDLSYKYWGKKGTTNGEILPQMDRNLERDTQSYGKLSKICAGLMEN